METKEILIEAMYEEAFTTDMIKEATLDRLNILIDTTSHGDIVD